MFRAIYWRVTNPGHWSAAFFCSLLLKPENFCGCFRKILKEFFLNELIMQHSGQAAEAESQAHTIITIVAANILCQKIFLPLCGR